MARQPLKPTAAARAAGVILSWLLDNNHLLVVHEDGTSRTPVRVGSDPAGNLILWLE